MSTERNKRAAMGTAAVVAAALAGAGLHSAFGQVEGAVAAPPAEATAVAAPDTPARTLAGELSDAFADLATAATPAVVRIEVRIPPGEGAATAMDDVPEPFRRFFDFRGQGPAEPGPRFGGGTGFLVSDDGYIVTNDHVVGDADQITVTLNDRRSFSAELVGTDPTTDVAVLKVDAEGLPHLAWGSSTELRVGAWVMAVGNPGYGGAGQLDYTVTTGIVSGKGRPLQLLTQGLAEDPRYGSEMAGYAIENFIQTDAVINPGNSGGPLLTLDGRVVGMNSAIASTDGHYQGYGFAIPADLVHKVVGDLMEHGSVRRAWLGVSVTEVAPEDADAFGLPAVEGVVVQGVTEGGPAADAGLRMGDVIVALDAIPVHSGGALQELVATRSQGDRVRVRVYRDGSARTLEVRLGDAPLGRQAERPAATPRSETSTSRTLGLTLSDLDAAAARRLGLDEAGGVVVSAVEPAGPAARRGVTVGARVVRIDREAVTSADEAVRLLSGVRPGQVVSLVLEAPGGQTRIVNVRAR